MVSNGKFLQFLKLIFFVTGMCTGVPFSAGAENGGSSSDDRAFKSFLDYTPRTAQFPQALQLAVSSIAAGRQAAKNKHPEDAAQSFRSALASLQAGEKSLNRGYQDQGLFLRGLAYEGLNQSKEALSAYTEALSIRPNNTLALFRHALLLKQSNRCNEAMPEFQEIGWQVKPLSYELDYLTAECLLTLNQTEEGLKLYRTAYQKNPTFLPVLRKMALTRSTLLAQTPDPKKRSELESQLVADLGSIIRQDPDDRESSLTLARILMKGNDPLVESAKISRAGGIAKRFADNSGYKDDVSVRMLFQAQLKLGDIETAEETLNKGLKLTPGSKELQAAKEQLEIEKNIRANPSLQGASDSDHKSNG